MKTKQHKSTQPVIDLRSDTVTLPSPGMLSHMMAAEVGDDVFGEDPSVNRLQELTAKILGKEEALFVPSGTMANQIAIHCSTRPGDEIICEADSHFLHYESGGIAALSGVHAHTIESASGIFTAEQIRSLVRPAKPYFPVTKLICVENTHNSAGGRIWPMSEIAALRQFADEHGLRMHLDGARLWNASVAAGIEPSEYAQHFDTVSVCFSKGLGAPVGSAVCGSRETIVEARRVRKMFGGSMRQAGYLAAAAIYALEHNIDRLEEDHRNAKRLAQRLNGVGGLKVNQQKVETNIVMIDTGASRLDSLEACEALSKEQVLTVPFSEQKLRAVTHLHITSDHVERAVAAFKRVFATAPS